ncbi:unnamed protein product [Coffea canephora]|uniref:Uncharacterized protein n=2 Tax=Coffea TaxID=13442 RepID=A0A068V8G4_COFCA|nr:uncharacterized protein LOC113735587 [Coffea arabica]CDP17080.1 unnamed protein product [Coffea canephora]
MGNAIPNRLPEATAKVILPDGTIQYYDKPLTVAELMLEYPQQVVIEYQQQRQHMIMKKPALLPADKKLEMNKVYLMLPMRRGKPAAAILSSQEARLLLLKANSILKSNSFISSTTGFLPLFARICAAGSGSELHDLQCSPPEGKKKPILSSGMDHRHHPNNNDNANNSCGRQTEEVANCKPDYFGDVLMEERPVFLSRQMSGKGGWKPSLDTITEKTVQTKLRHWLF